MSPCARVPAAQPRPPLQCPADPARPAAAAQPRESSVTTQLSRRRHGERSYTRRSNNHADRMNKNI